MNKILLALLFFAPTLFATKQAKIVEGPHTNLIGKKAIIKGNATALLANVTPDQVKYICAQWKLKTLGDAVKASIDGDDYYLQEEWLQYTSNDEQAELEATESESIKTNKLEKEKLDSPAYTHSGFPGPWRRRCY